jgi:hypothetical protein
MLTLFKLTFLLLDDDVESSLSPKKSIVVEVDEFFMILEHDVELINSSFRNADISSVVVALVSDVDATDLLDTTVSGNNSLKSPVLVKTEAWSFEVSTVVVATDLVEEMLAGFSVFFTFILPDFVIFSWLWPFRLA